MDYMNAKEAADKWGLSVRRVQVLCEQGRVDGVERLGNVWLIPKSAEKPLDGRTREVKKQKQKQKSLRLLRQNGISVLRAAS